jgi:curved DNA binding protein
VDGASVWEICQTIDAFILEGLQGVYNSKATKKTERGQSMPTCISVNNIMGHYSPLEDESIKLANGDVAKVVTGCHIDGWASNAAFTCVVGASETNKVSGVQNDIAVACHAAQLAAQRAIRIGNTNRDVTRAIARVCEAFKVNPVEAVLSHKILKYCIDSNETIIQKETSTQQVNEWAFQAGDVIGLDVYVSSGEGIPKEDEARCTVFKRELNKQYMLKMKSSRAFFSEMDKRFPSMPFSIRQFENPTGARAGVTECLTHNLIQDLPVFCDKKDALVAQEMCTVAILTKSV